MVESSIINIEKLLLPINDTQPQGVDLRTDPVLQAQYYDLKELRQTLRQQEQNELLAAEQSASFSPPSWQSVIDLTSQLLAEKSKDIEIASWLTEALTREHGFAGMAAGFELLTKLVKQYQANLYPLPDDDEDDSRLLSIAALNGENHGGTLTTAIYLTPLISDDSISLSSWEIRQTLAEAEPGQQQATLEKVKNRVNNVEPDLFLAQEQLLDNTLQIINECYDALTEYYKTAPSLRGLINLLNECKQYLTKIAPAVVEEAMTTETEPHTQQEKNSTTEKNSSSNRDEALTAINKALLYYQNYEPHSPIGFLLHRVVRWSHASLPEILNEIIEDDTTKLNFARMLGLMSEPIESSDPIESDEN